MKVEGKVIVITGGGAGIGRFLALELIKRNAKVAICDINQEFMDETLDLGNNHQEFSAHKLDVTDQNRVNKLPKEIIEKHGAIDI